MIKKLVLLTGVLVMASSSFATYTTVLNPADIGANDFIDWHQFGADFTTVASGVHGFTNNGIGFTLSSVAQSANDDGGLHEIRTQGTSWDGNFSAGDSVLWHRNSGINFNSWIAVIFDSKIDGVGTSATSNLFGDFIASADVFDADAHVQTKASSTSVFGTMNGAGNGSAPFFGFTTDSHDIGALYINVRMFDGVSDDLGFATNQWLIKDNGAVPEPASMAALGLGVAALIRRRKNRS